VTKPLTTLRKDADAAFQRNDFRSGMVVLGQRAAVAPDDASTWLRLARTLREVKPRDFSEKALLSERARRIAMPRRIVFPCWATHSPSGSTGDPRSTRCASR
jgi:alpha-2-macroglobulin